MSGPIGISFKGPMTKEQQEFFNQVQSQRVIAAPSPVSEEISIWDPMPDRSYLVGTIFFRGTLEQAAELFKDIDEPDAPHGQWATYCLSDYGNIMVRVYADHWNRINAPAKSVLEDHIRAAGYEIPGPGEW